MAMREGETYRCINSDRNCVIEVTRGAGPGGGAMNPRCCCGMEMRRAE